MFTETTQHITFNKHGTPVLAETNTSIVPIGVAHENGVSEQALIDQYEITRAQLHAALSFFYEHRDEVKTYQAETKALLQQYGTDGWASLDDLDK